MACKASFNAFSKLIQKIDEKVAIQKDKDKPLRYNVWTTTSESLSELFDSKDGTAMLNDEDPSPTTVTKIENALLRVLASPNKASTFRKKVLDADTNIEMSIALHEVMESVKGESDKARNLGLDIAGISADGVLPAIPESRIAASIGRKIMFQKGYRFKSDKKNRKTAAQIESLYYGIGNKALTELSELGYIDFHKKLPTIKDYMFDREVDLTRVRKQDTTSEVSAISLNAKKLGIVKGKKNKVQTEQANHFLNRTEANIDNTELGTIVNMLTAARHITQPATIVVPDTEAKMSMEELAELDDPTMAVDEKTAKVRKKLYDTPVFMHKTIHELMDLLNAESKKDGKSGSKIIREIFQGHDTLINSLFGIKRSDDHSVDKKESIRGQNLSKTVPLDDIVENFEALQNGKKGPQPLHMALRIGRNARMYYVNSVLNPHASKHSRYMLTSGEYTVDLGSADYKYLVYGMSQALGNDNLTFKDFTGETDSVLDDALDMLAEYEGSNDLKIKLSALSSLAVMFPGVDYVTLLTTVKAVQDIRNPKDGKVTTEFNVSADATASGGTLTFMQALGTNENVEQFLERIGLLSDKNGNVIDPDDPEFVKDLYGIMQDSISDFVAGKRIPGLIGQDVTKKGTKSGTRKLLSDTVDLLFDYGEDTRNLSKDPTMTFVYGQGRTGAMDSMARSLADRIIDGTDDPNTREYLSILLNDKKYKNINAAELKNTKKLYPDIVKALKVSGLTGQLYDLMNASINKRYLEDYKTRSGKVFNLIEKINSKVPFKMMPAAAKLHGYPSNMTHIQKYGMPISKVTEIASNTEIGEDNDFILTRKPILAQSVFDVSTIHGLDAAQLYHSIGDVNPESGTIVVHDDVRGSVQTVRAMEDAYREKTKKLMSQYDIHHQAMLSIAAYDPKLAQTDEFTQLMGEIEADIAAKQEILNNRFNDATNALIGDGAAYEIFAGDTPTKPGPKPKTKAKTPTADTVDTQTTPEAVEAPVTAQAAETTNEIDEVVEAETEQQAEPAVEDKPDVRKQVKTAKKKANMSDKEYTDENIDDLVEENKAKQEQADKEPTQAQKDSEQAKTEKAYVDAYGEERIAAEASLRYLNQAVAIMLNSKLERKGKKILGNIHDVMQKRFPLYSDVSMKAQGVYDGSPALQQLVHTITGNGIDKTKKADILAMFAKVMGEQTESINHQMGLFHETMNQMDEKEKETIGRFVTEMPLHDYFEFLGEMDNEAALAAELKKIRKRLNRLQPNAVRDIDDLVAWNVRHDEKSKGRIYNLDAAYPLEGKFGEDVRKLLVLQSIKEIGYADFEKFLGNTDLVNLIKDNVMANRLSLLENEGASLLNDSMVIEYYKEPVQIKAIELNEFGQYETGEDTGWKVLKAPTKNELGIVYKYTIDSSDIPGAFTDIKLSTTDIDVVGRKAEYKGVVKTKNGFKFRLTKAQKEEIGLVKDFSQGLVRGTAHSMAIKESQIIRDEMLKAETRMFVGSDQKKLVDIIDSDQDNPWFLKLKRGTTYADLDPKIKAKYMVVGKRASNVKGFNEEVDLVRKDISHWLIGANAQSIFNDPKMKIALRVTKDFIAGAKIGMIVLNPVKIAKDNASNIAYLGTMGVSPLFIAKNYKDIAQDFQEYSDLKRQMIQLKVRLTARPESTKIKKQIKTLQSRLKDNPLGDLGEKGFINSLGSDLVARNADTLSGLQADMHTALEYLLKNKEGKNNYVSHFILKLQELGFNGEDFLTYIGKISNKASKKSGKGVKHELDQVADRLKEIRTEKDIVNYVSQYTTSPSSEAVRLGSAMTDLTDVLAKETLYRHLVENDNMSPEGARIKVLDSFPDYKENMPLAVKQLSDVGIIMFPSFWLRIQKTIYRLGRDKPINLASELMVQEALDSNLDTIVDSNLINKANTFGGLLHTPFEPMGTGSIFPEHLW